VGLLYEQGYFTQTVDNDGNQHAEYSERDPRDLPVERLGWPTESGSRSRYGLRPRRGLPALEGPGGAGFRCTCWIPTARRTRPRIATSLTGSMAADESTRIRQEMILGIGGTRALRALGIAPAVWHLNEDMLLF